jgi:hypothetical protein
VQKLVLGHLEEALHNMPHEHCNLLLGDLALLLEERAEVALVAELSDDVAMRGVPDDVVALEDVGVLQLGERFNLAI